MYSFEFFNLSSGVSERNLYDEKERASENFPRLKHILFQHLRPLWYSLML